MVKKRKEAKVVVEETGDVFAAAYYRERRGKMVRIPKEWEGKTTHPQTKRKRPSKLTRKARNNNEVRAYRRCIPGEDFGGRSLSMEKLRHMQGDYLDDEE